VRDVAAREQDLAQFAGIEIRAGRGLADDAESVS
jgi:hypothetical protein